MTAAVFVKSTLFGDNPIQTKIEGISMRERNRFSSSFNAHLYLGAALLIQLAVTSVMANDANDLVASKCGSCHPQLPNGGFARIDESRRTPEGWDMTVARMMQAHGVKLTADERRVIIKQLADSRGLAPSETKDFRYILEREPSVVEHFENDTVGQTCARCHSYARIAIQRRTEEDWRRLSHYHVGQFPAIEIQQGGRDRDWWDIASQQVPAILGKLYPNDAKAWEKWKAKPKNDMSGNWRLAGHRPGVGAYEGEASIRSTGEDEYAISMELRYETGQVEKAAGKGVLFTGHEWRGSVRQGDERALQIFSLSEDGNGFSGRWHLEEVDSIGGELRAVRKDAGAKPTILAVQPGHLKAGTRQQLTIHGVGLAGDVSLGAGTRVVKVVKRSADSVTVEVEADAKAGAGLRSVKVGRVEMPEALSLYRQVDYVRIHPEHAMARIGGNGGTKAKIPAQLEAISYDIGADGKADTADDVRIGSLPAQWTMAALNDKAAHMKDPKYAGQLQQSGLFLPSVGGPNPERKFGTNNVGELRITAQVEDGGRKVSASAPLMVTVQRWNDPPVR